MKKIFFLIIITFISATVYAQQEASNWFFGDGAGIQFNQDGTITATTGNLNTDEGCTSISDTNGQLLFYTDGITVYDRNNNIMPNGFGLKGNPSSTQSALIVPKPLDPNIYYIFTVDTAFGGNSDEGFHFYEVDMTLNGGLGNVVVGSETQLLGNSTEKISAVLDDCNTQDIWVITLSNLGGTPATPNSFTYNTFHAYKVTSAGVETTAETSSAGISLDEQRGYLKFSPDGEKLAIANIDEGLFVYEFDVAQGKVTGPPTALSITTASNGAIFSYGIEFSPNSELLYVSTYNNFSVQPFNNPENDNPNNHWGSLVQFDLTAANIQASQIPIDDQRNSYRTALQTGPDGKIYRTASDSYNNGRPHLSVINNPNEIGAACAYEHEVIDLINDSRQGLPPFIASFFVDTIDIINDPQITSTTLSLCEGETYTLTASETVIPGAIYTWKIDGVNQPTPATPNEFVVTQPGGLYEVVIDLNNTTCDVQTGIADVQYFSLPVAYTVPDQLICDDNNDGFWDFDLDTLRLDILGIQDSPTQFAVSFHLEELDANTSSVTSSLPDTFTNLVAYEEDIIWVRIENVVNTNCSDISSFTIDVSEQAVPPPVYTYGLCDTNTDSDDTNGFVEFNLRSIESDILINQDDSSVFTVTYHETQLDADAGSGIVPDLLYTSNRQVFAKVKNNDNPSCNTTVVIDLEVYTLPVITDMVELLQCDTDTDGISDFNLTESEILISNNFAAETFTYHMSFADADTGTDPIPNFLAYPNTDPSSNPDTLFVRTENADGCHRVAQLDLFVSTTSIPPGFMINTYQECDDTRVDANITDGITTFDFSDATPLIVGLFPPGQIITVTYYETTADALAEINAIPDISNHINTASPFNQTITYRIDSDVDNSCLGIGEFELETINPMPNLNPDPIILCDDITVGDLVETFDLTQQETFIFNGETNVSATYHLDYDQAVAGSDVIVTPAAYNNTDPFETIYIRVTNTDNCFAIVELNIQVNPLPDDSAVVTDYFECENNTDFFFDFDLETKTLEVLNGQNTTQFTVTYHDTQLDADNLTNPLASPYTNIISPQPIFVAITNNTTGCSISTITFNIEINEGAIALDDFYEECDVVNDNDGFTQFDLGARSPVIMDGADPMAFSISYHFSFDDAFNDVDPLPLLYENLTNPQLIYARVSNVIRPAECFAISEVTLQVNLLPIFDLEDEYILCLTSNNEAVVDVPPILDTGLSDADYAFEWRLDGVVLTTETSSSLIPAQGGTYEVTVTDTSTSTVTMCQNFDSTEVIESGIPDTFTVEVTSLAFSGNNMIIVTATGNSTYEYSLDNGPWQLDTDFENVTGGQHTVYARDILGCGIISEMVTVIDYPKFFTPNGDGNNDTWNIRGINTQPAAVIYIYDRYGKLLKQLSPTSPGWDGTFNGNRIPSSDYWFTLEYFEPIANETRTFTAHFSLKR